MSNKYPGGFVSLGGPVSNSNSFNGSSQCLNAPADAAFAFGTGNFTVEAWVFVTVAQEILLFDTRSSASTAGFGCRIGSDLKLYYSDSANNALTTTAITLGTWTHIAWVRSGTTLTGYINGISGGTASNGNNITQNNAFIGKVGFASSGYMAGYISNFRAVKGTAVYTANFVPPTGQLQNISGTSLLTCQSQTIVDNSTNAFAITNTGGVSINASTPFTAYNPNNLDPALGAATPGIWTLDQALNAEVTRSWPMYDPYYKNVVLNLHGEGTNGAQNNTFLDSSTNNFTITRNGNTTQGTFSPYGQGWSNYFDGSSYLGLPTSQTPLALGSSDFTVEAWVYRASGTGTATILGGQTDAATLTGSSYVFYISSSATCDLYIGGSSYYVASPNPPIGQWSHVAYVRTGGTFSTYLNGSLVATRTDLGTGSVNVGSTTYRASIGALTAGASNLTGYISNLRLIKGSGGYNATSSTITVPAAPLSLTANTTLLTCQSNRLIDSSTNAFALTTSGSPSVQRFQPFLFNTSYTPSTIGGSGYFDGTGDYLTSTVPSLNATWTVEGWIYRTSGAVNQCFAFMNTGSTNGVIIYIDSSNYIIVNDGSTAQPQFTTVAVPVNAWTHIAIVRSGGTTTGYVNGAVAGSHTFTPAGVSAVNIGYYYGGNPMYFPGWISNFRFVNGTAVYTGAFTPSTSPLTAITNTALLLSMTNAGIVDNAMMNDLETVGNAQISTSVKKYGTGSMYFDGTGDYLQTITTPNLQLGTSAFTVEFWLYSSVSQTNKAIIGNRTSSAVNTAWVVKLGSTSGVYDSISIHSSDTVIFNGVGTITAGQWYHVAWTRQGTTNYLFINGILVASTTTGGSFNFNTTQPLYIANDGYAGATDPLNGYIDDLRITKGVARYVANFTPPTSQLQDQ